MKQTKLQAYWQKNIRYLLSLLTIWFIASYGCGILFVDELNAIRIGGFKLGFWFAQQGSIYIFVVLIFVYVYLMNKLDKAYDVDETEQPDERAIHITSEIRPGQEEENFSPNA